MLRISSADRFVTVHVGVKSEERVGVPYRNQDLSSDVIDTGVRDTSISTSDDVCGHQIPTQSVRTLRVEDLIRLGVVP